MRERNRKIYDLVRSPFKNPKAAVSPLDFDKEIIHSSEADHPIVRTLLERREDPNSSIGSRPDGRTIALAIEGGGMTGVISAGMATFLSQAQLIPCFDKIYGCSAGALTGMYTASNQASLGSTLFQDMANFNLSNPFNTLVKKPVMNLDNLFNQAIGKKKPISFQRLLEGPDLFILATSVNDPERRILSDFNSVEDVLAAAKASCSLPVLAGASVYKSELLVDGGLIEAVPYQAAIDQGATDVLVLRSKRADYRSEPYRWPAKYIAENNSPPSIWPLIKNKASIYNNLIKTLDNLIEDTTDESDVRVAQITLPEKYKQPIGKLNTNRKNIDAGFELGLKSAAKIFVRREIEVFWTPTIYTD